MVCSFAILVRRPSRQGSDGNGSRPAPLRPTTLLAARNRAHVTCHCAVDDYTMLFPAVLLFSLASLASAYRALSDTALAKIPGPGSDFDIKTGALLAPILRPRVSGTQGNAAVRQHFLDFFAARLPAWRIELHNSTSTTPLSGGAEVPFVNIIATRDPPGAPEGDVSRLALVAHYDSKLTPEGFIGAIDSAAPCAMLLHVARTLDAALTRKWAEGAGDELEVEHKGVQILLLDGEEAFHSWTDTDSLYGAR
jgi:glutaminyl-peptide cyclotransferase